MNNVRFPDIIKQLPGPQKIALVASLVALAITATFVVKVVAEPSYAVAYANLDQATASEVLAQLDASAVPYKLEGNGTRILVPRAQLDRARLDLAAAGINAAAAAPGYELLDGQPASMSTMRQQVDLRRALEGELARTLTTMSSVDAATVLLVTPEKRLFTEDDTTPTASVMLTTRATLRPDEVDTVAALVASAVEDLKPSNVTVADTQGNVLQSPATAGAGGGATSRHLRYTAEYEQTLAARAAQVIGALTGDDRAAVVVTADLKFDETTVEAEDYDPEQQVTLAEDTESEAYEGTGADTGGTLGVDGGPLPATDGTAVNQDRGTATREYGYDRTVTRTVVAPGAIARLSVAVVMDDGSLTGARVPPQDDIIALVTTAAGLDVTRGDAVTVQLLPFPVMEDIDVPEVELTLADRLPLFASVAMLLLITITLALLAWRRRRPAKAATVDTVDGDALTEASAAIAHDDDAGAPSAAPAKTDANTDAARRQAEARVEEVRSLIDAVPDQVALLVRTWLSDR